MGMLNGGPARLRALSAAEIAWVALLPCAALGVAAILLLGPPLGEALFAPGEAQLWPPGWWETMGQPEPIKQGRYVVAVLAPTLLVAAVLVGSRRDRALPPLLTRTLVLAGQALALALVAAALLEQQPLLALERPAPAIFGLGTVVLAAALVAVTVVALSRPSVAGQIGRMVRETPARRWAALVLAAAFAVAWLLKAVTTDELAGDIQGINLPWTLNDAVAVLDGRTPLVDYRPIYAKLLPYPTALALSTFGTTTFVYTATMAALNVLVLLAVYAILRLVTRRSLLALALFLPFVATSDLDPGADPTGVGSPMTLSAMWPMRYGGAYALAWLTARHLDGRWPRQTWVVFFVAGLGAVNTLDFGAAALLATGAALVCARPPRSAREAGRLALGAAGGVAGAVTLVALFTLVRAGELPRPELLLEWPRIFARLGWFSMPLPTWDLHLAIYATFVAAMVVAAVRLARSDADALLTGMLAWSGVFGLLAGSYYIGRPDTFKLTGILSAWSFALALLVVACVRTLAARGWRRPSPAQLLVLFGFALSICLLGRLSPPQEQIARLTEERPPPVYQAAAEQFVRERTRSGETTAILLPMSYRISHALGIENVSPYPFMNAIVTRAQMRTLLDTLRREDVDVVYLPLPNSFLAQEGDAAPAHLQVLGAAGYHPVVLESEIVELRPGGQPPD